MDRHEFFTLEAEISELSEKIRVAQHSLVRNGLPSFRLKHDCLGTMKVNIDVLIARLNSLRDQMR
jgi:hypothetical protein